MKILFLLVESNPFIPCGHPNDALLFAFVGGQHKYPSNVQLQKAAWRGLNC